MKKMLFKQKIFKTIQIAVFLFGFFALAEKSSAEIIFQDDFDGVWYQEHPDWNCGQSGVPVEWTSKAGCGQETDDQTGISHWCGEINSGGRSGNGWASWRKDRFGNQGYCGYLNYNFPAEKLTPSNRYTEIYSRWSMKVPSDYSFAMTGPQTWKINRLYIDDASGNSREIYYGWQGVWEKIP